LLSHYNIYIYIALTLIRALTKCYFRVLNGKVFEHSGGRITQFTNTYTHTTMFSRDVHIHIIIIIIISYNAYRHMSSVFDYYSLQVACTPFLRQNRQHSTANDIIINYTINYTYYESTNSMVYIYSCYDVRSPIYNILRFPDV
jgi:hypothetical protein